MEKNEVLNDLDVYKSLEALHLSDGGKILMDGLRQESLSCVEQLFSMFRTASHTELIAVIAKLQLTTNMMRTLSRSSKNKEMAEETLKQFVGETLAE